MGSGSSVKKDDPKDIHPELKEIHGSIAQHKFNFQTAYGAQKLKEVQEMRKKLQKLGAQLKKGTGLCCVAPKFRPPLDPGFRPFILGKRAYMKQIEKCETEIFEFALIRQNDLCGRFKIPVFAESSKYFGDSQLYAGTIIKFAIWQRGGFQLLMKGPKKLCEYFKDAFNLNGIYSFDIHTMEKIYKRKFTVEIMRNDEDLPTEKEEPEKVNTTADGCRIAFDLGKSDFKIVAVKDGEVVFSKESAWNIWEKNPDYHYEQVLKVLKEAAATLPQIDGMGGSTAGVPINNDCVWSDCFPDIEEKLYAEKVVPIFKRWAKALGNPPLKVINDGEVTALAGMQMVGEGGLFGISMGSNEGAGYVRPDGQLQGWINELWAGTVDFNPRAAFCPWSGARGNGSMYFGQRAVEKLCEVAGFSLPEDMLPQIKLKEIQKYMKQDNINAALIYESIGIYLGYAVAGYAELGYKMKHVMILGRCTSGKGGDIILKKAAEVIRAEFPDLKDVKFHTPNEHMKRVGQCVAAAALPLRRKGETKSS